MSNITLKALWKQLKADLIGKDSYRGVSLTYSWLANQLGHFTLGFIPTLLLYKWLVGHSQINNKAFFAAICISALWTLFELYNFLGPLLFSRRSRSNLIYIPGPEYVFKPQWFNIAFDTFTDVCFFSLGAFVSANVIEPGSIPNWPIYLLLFTLAYPIYYWYSTKLMLQEARYPFQFRLSQWDFKIEELDKDTVKAFQASGSGTKHLLIFGGRKSGKTEMAVGIGTETSIKNARVSYTTGMKLFNLFAIDSKKLISENDSIWTWRSASLLIIDDINPGPPYREEIVSPDRFRHILDQGNSPSVINRDAITKKSVIWVMGHPDPDQAFLKSWKEMIIGLGVKEHEISTVNLAHHKQS
ncbi:hypothetical protein [Daejeonella sp.]|uniref:hypothetical protein n=1 Tax=Daejeonella sp. TaxID=2805397 RepID=UPI0030BBFC39